MKRKKSFSEKNLIALVMAGGASSRLYPFDKVLSDLTDCGRTMIQQAMDRVVVNSPKHGKALVSKKDFFVVTGAAYKPRMEKQLKGVPRLQILAEPERRNTWPAILWSLAHLRRGNPQAVVMVLTGDHLIGDWRVFRGQLRDAVKIARDEKAIVTFGIPPAKDAKKWTGFGAIKAAKSQDGAARVLRFEEKPSESRAFEMIREGGYFWNSGMFVAALGTLETALRCYQPEIFQKYSKLCDLLSRRNKGKEAAECFKNFPSKIPHPAEPSRIVDHSIDYAVMVPLTNDPESRIRAYVIPARFSWVDIGSWDNLRCVLAPDRHGNITAGKSEAKNCESCILVAKRGVRIEADGLSKCIVVAAENAAVILPEERAQEAKSLYQETQRPGAGKVVLMESSGCQIIPDGKSVAALGISRLRIEWKKNILKVERSGTYGK